VGGWSIELPNKKRVVMNYPWDFHRHLSPSGTVEEEVQARRPSLLCSAGIWDWKRLIEVSHKAHQHKVAIGIHPWSTTEKTVDDLQSDFENLKSLIKENPKIHIGETGLDTLKGATFEVLKEWFTKHLELAFEEKRLCVIHCVRAYSELMGVLNQMNEKRKLPRCMLHYFGGSPQIASQLSDLGVALSFNIGRVKKAEFFEFNEKIEKSLSVSKLPLFESDEEGPREAEPLWEKIDEAFPRKVGALEWTVKAQSFWNDL